jgi:hypothetical protein
MHANRRPRASGALLALVLCLALLGPGAAARGTGVDVASTSLTGGPAAGPEQGVLRDLSGRALVAAGGTRNDRERPGLALVGLLATTVAAAWAVVAGRLAAGAGGSGATAAGARAPPPLQPAPI